MWPYTLLSYAHYKKTMREIAPIFLGQYVCIFLYPPLYAISTFNLEIFHQREEKKMQEDYSCSFCLWQMARNLFQYHFDSQKTLILSSLSMATFKPFFLFIYHEGVQDFRCPGVYLPRILRFSWQRTANTAPCTSVHPQLLSLGRLGEHWDVQSTVEVIIATLTQWTLPHPTHPHVQLTTNMGPNPLNNGRLHIIGGIIDGISSIYYRITVSCFVLMKACFIIWIFIMIQ